MKLCEVVLQDCADLIYEDEIPTGEIDLNCIMRTQCACNDVIERFLIHVNLQLFSDFQVFSILCRGFQARKVNRALTNTRIFQA